VDLFVGCEEVGREAVFGDAVVGAAVGVVEDVEAAFDGGGGVGGFLVACDGEVSGGDEGVVVDFES